MGRMYVAGRIIEIDAKHFNGAVMEKVEDPKPIESPTAEFVTVKPEESFSQEEPPKDVD